MQVVGDLTILVNMLHGLHHPGQLTLPFSVVAAKSFASGAASELCNMAKVEDHASVCVGDSVETQAGPSYIVLLPIFEISLGIRALGTSEGDQR